MLKVTLAHAIIEMVELTLRCDDHQHALIVPVRLSMKGHDSRFLDLFFYRGSNYTTVGSRTNVVPSKLMNTEWKLEANHVSSWRYDINSPLSKFYLDMCRDCSPELEPENVEVEARFHPSPYMVKIESISRTDITLYTAYRV